LIGSARLEKFVSGRLRASLNVEPSQRSDENKSLDLVALAINDSLLF
jgi:hypothetical protein